MNEKIQQLTFEKGITNVPSDAVCSDNELEECMGLYHDGAEHRPIQKPVEYVELPEGHTMDLQGILLHTVRICIGYTIIQSIL